MFFDSKRFLYYFRLTPDRRMLFGGRASFVPESPVTVRESALTLRRGMVEIFPQLRGTAVEYAWGGTLDCAVDLMPHAGRLDGMYYALGYAGHGVALATYLGTRLGVAIAAGDHSLPLSGLRFPAAPFGLDGGKPWFLPLVGVWYRFLDWVA
jgi:glycine/D-amino acid oxidase-like deaminating enzyme